MLLSNIKFSKDSINIAEIENLLAVEGLMIKSVKNNYAKLALMENKALINAPNNPLFRASNLLLAFKDISLLTKIKHFIEDKELNVLGAIYEHNNVLDTKQIKTLASLNQNKQIYVSLITTLKTINIRPYNQLSHALDFGYLLQNHYKILALSKVSSNKQK